ncbi:MAG: DUF2225 domain-containing protein [Muribaculum sp.]|nr:DUF2225 domain-containing protein [Muribaculum sp.]
MAGLLSGLGLDELEGVDIYADPGKKQKEEQEAVKNTVEEKDLIYEKAFVCPVCDAKFTNKIMKTGKARLLGMDRDLRPIHEGVDTQKYDVLLCPKCGYAAISRFFTQVTSTQAKFIKEHISQKVQLREYKGETYSYEEAIERYKLALANAVVKRAKNSEKAYICLKSAWIFRGYAKFLEESGGSADKIQEARDMEAAHMENAYKGFTDACQTESFPMCGMDEMTIDYLIAVMAFRFKEYDIASKMVATIITSPVANNRTKDKARDLKDEILAEMKKGK